VAALFSSCAPTGGNTNSNPASSATAPAASQAGVEQEIRKLAQEYDNAWLNEDAAAFGRLLADEATQIDPDGKVLSEAEVIANAKSGDLKIEVGHSDDLKYESMATRPCSPGAGRRKAST
jgi:hypothetical protein